MPIQVLDRAMKILRVVAKRGASSLTEISKEVRLPLPTTSRITRSLVDNGMLQRADGRKYNLGVRLLPLMSQLEPFRRSLAVIHPFIEELSRQSREDCGFAVLQGNEAVVVDWCYGPSPPRIIEPFSREIPLYCAFGKVLIAFQPAAWRTRFVQTAKLEKLAAGTVPSKAALLAEIAAIRQTGLHVSIAENVDGAGSLTVPVFDDRSRLLGAMFVTAPLERFGSADRHRQRAMLVDTARRLRSQLQPTARGPAGRRTA